MVHVKTKTTAPVSHILIIMMIIKECIALYCDTNGSLFSFKKMQYHLCL